MDEPSLVTYVCACTDLVSPSALVQNLGTSLALVPSGYSTTDIIKLQCQVGKDVAYVWILQWNIKNGACLEHIFTCTYYSCQEYTENVRQQKSYMWVWSTGRHTTHVTELVVVWSVCSTSTSVTKSNIVVAMVTHQTLYTFASAIQYRCMFWSYEVRGNYEAQETPANY